MYMKKFLYMILAAATAASAQNIDCHVVGIADGDTLTCLTAEHQPLKVRLNQIDAPERGQAFGQAAKRKLSKLVYQKNVELKTDGQDKYGRTLAEVFIGGENINKEMVRAGYAWAFRKHLKDNEYLQLEEYARNHSLGLWSEPYPIYPSEYRHGKQASEISHSVQPFYAVKAKSKGFTCAGKRFCRQMTSCAEAKFYLHKCGVHRLDRDNDGKPCESLC